MQMLWCFQAVDLQIDSEAVFFFNGIFGDSEGIVMGWRLDNSGWRIRISHEHREANACADALANLSYGLQLGFMMYEQPPAISQLLLADSRGVVSPRIISL